MSITIKPNNPKLYEFHRTQARWEAFCEAACAAYVYLSVPLIKTVGAISQEEAIALGRRISYMAVQIGDGELFEDAIELAGWLLLCGGCEIS